MAEWKKTPLTPSERNTQRTHGSDLSAGAFGGTGAGHQVEIQRWGNNDLQWSGHSTLPAPGYIPVNTEGLDMRKTNPSDAEMMEFRYRQVLAKHQDDQRQVTEDELRNNKEWVLASKTWWEYLNDKPFTGTDQEAVQYGMNAMSNNYALFNTDLPWTKEDSVGLIGFVNQIQDAPDHAKMAAAFLHLMYEDKDTTIGGVGRATRATFNDPTTYLGVGTVIGMVGRYGGRSLLKTAITHLLRAHIEKQVAKSAAKATTKKSTAAKVVSKVMSPTAAVMTAEGGAFSGAFDVEHQMLERELAAHLHGQNQPTNDFDWKRNLSMIGLGAASGYGLNRAAAMAAGLWRGAAATKADLTMHPTDLSEINVVVPRDTTVLDLPPPRLGDRTPKNDAAIIKELLALYPQAKPLIPFLSAREISMLNRPQMGKRIDKILEIAAKFDEAGLSDEIQSIALAGAAKKGWYKESGQLLFEVFGQDLPRFSALLAALSPQTSVQINLKNALSMWKAWDAAGRPQDPDTIRAMLTVAVPGSDKMDAWSNNATTALTESSDEFMLSGSKVDSFMRNIMGDSDAVTLDAWMARYFGIEKARELSGGATITGTDPGFNALYQASSVVVRQGAAQLSKRTGKPWSPAEVQETVWSFVRTAYEMRRDGDPRTLMEIIKSGDLTPEVLRGTDDFATLMGSDDVRSLLQGTGYGSRLEGALRRRGDATDIGQSTAAQSGGRSVNPKPGHLRELSERLELDFRASPAGDKAATGVVTRLRKSLDLTSSSGLDSGKAGSTRGVGNRVSPKSTSTFTAGSRRYRTRDLGGLLHRVFRPAANYAAKLNSLGRSTPPVAELETGINAANLFIKGITKSKNEGIYGAAVHVYEPDEYAAMRLFMSKDGTSGFALKDGDIVSVFNLRAGPNDKITPHLLMLAIEQGGRKLDCFDTVLPSNYSKLGFRAVARTKWSDKHKSDDWSYETFKVWNEGRPDVVYMIYDPKYVAKGDKKYKITDGPFVADPDEAAAIQAAELKKLGLD